MTIDFHTHIFPDALSEKALKSLREGCEDAYIPVHDATKAGLLAYMKDSGVGASVILPVITRQSQFKSANDFAAGAACEKIIAFGGLFPHTDDYKRDGALRADGLGMTHYGYDFAYFLRNFGDMRSYFHSCLLCVALRYCK